MTGPVSGDSASCSQLGGSLRQLATRLRSTGRAAHDAFDNGDRARPGPVLVQARRRVDLLDTAAATAAREVDRIGTALQAHASDLAEAVAHSRLLTDRAEAAGLRVVDGELTAGWGVRGVADEQARTQQTALRERLQAELDTVTALVGRRRARLTAALRESHDVLATHAGALRR
ncbi:hypothetical protein [Pedococcus bigeumensis]|uniref:hypothetical protein n=1 Tax=Pedococcus bigeumensis TaxID=433644 RepID=UPI00112D6292|nr:hypothetical protein [Pedococcus bigeumensis]